MIFDDARALRDHLDQDLPDARVVLTNGCFDLLHVGHVRLLEDARSRGDLLVVGVNVDETVRASKGEGRPVVSLADRMEMLAALRPVDHVVAFAEPTADALIRTVKPAVYAKGTDWTAAEVPERDSALKVGADIVICGDAKTRSSSAMIERAR